MKRGGGSKKSSKAATSESSRPYHECPFCKHGFTTPQALGGHMNIHRHDRASSRRPAGRDAASPAYPPAPPMPMDSSSFAATYYYDSGASAAAGAMSYYGTATQMTEPNLFGAAGTTHHDHDLRLGLGSCRVPGEWELPDGGEAERSLDLELRLGRHPGWQ